MRRLGLVGAIVAVAAALAALGLAAQPWFSGTVAGESSLSGQALTGGLATAVPTAAAVAVALVLVFGRLGRRLLGGLLVLLGGGMVATALAARTSTVVGASGLMGAHTGVWLGYIASGVAVLIGGAMLAWQPGAQRTRTVGKPRDDAWSVLDRGADPTLDGH